MGLNMKPVNFGVVGTGVGATFAIRALKELEKEGLVKVVAVVSRRESRARDFASKWGVEKWYTDYVKMYKEVKPDAVAICTPHYLHFPMVIDAINEGINVLVDKPMAINLHQTDAMIKAAEKAGVKLGVIFQSRFDPKIRKVKEAVDTGKMGKLIMGEAVVEWFRTEEYYSKSPWRGRWSTEGGGALINQAIHTIDLLLWIMGEPECLWSQVGTVAHEIEVEDLAVALIKFKNGAFGIIQGSTAIYPGLPTRLEIHGINGTAIVEGDKLKLLAIKGEETYSEVEEKGELAAWARPEAVPPYNHIALIRDFAQAILEDRKPLVDGYEGRRSIEVIRAIYRSGMTGEIVKFPFVEF